MTDDQIAHLAHLVRLRQTAARLDIQDITNSVTRKNVVSASNASRESEFEQHRAEVIEVERPIGSAR